MRWTNFAKIFSIITYSIGANIVLGLAAIWLFGPDKPINPDSMLPITWRDNAFVGLALGCIPMLLACIAAYAFNRNFIQNSAHPKRNSFLIFLPGIICLICALVVIGALAIGYAKWIIMQNSQ